MQHVEHKLITSIAGSSLVADSVLSTYKKKSELILVKNFATACNTNLQEIFFA